MTVFVHRPLLYQYVTVGPLPLPPELYYIGCATFCYCGPLRVVLKWESPTISVLQCQLTTLRPVLRFQRRFSGIFYDIFI